jgi:hypothetical protein
MELGCRSLAPGNIGVKGKSGKISKEIRPCLWESGPARCPPLRWQECVLDSQKGGTHVPNRQHNNVLPVQNDEKPWGWGGGNSTSISSDRSSKGHSGFPTGAIGVLRGTVSRKISKPGKPDWQRFNFRYYNYNPF